MHQVVRATQNFSESLKIGEGGFGTVYKAKLPDGVVVAIKRAKKVTIWVHVFSDANMCTSMIVV